MGGCARLWFEGVVEAKLVRGGVKARRGVAMGPGWSVGLGPRDGLESRQGPASEGVVRGATEPDRHVRSEGSGSLVSGEN